MGEKIYIADKETLDKVYNILASDPVFGFIEHNSILSPGSRIEYIGLNKDYAPLVRNKTNGSMALNSWADFPLIKANKPYMVRADGTPDYRLKETDYTQRESGGASDVANSNYNGGAFSWLMKIYKNEEMVGDDRIVRFSFTARDGYEPVGFIDPNNKELEGVWLPMYYGSILGADGATPRMVSLSGMQPHHTKDTAAQKTAITNFSSRAVFLGGPIVETITDLLIMFAKTTNLQEAYGYGNCAGSVHVISKKFVQAQFSAAYMDWLNCYKQVAAFVTCSCQSGGYAYNVGQAGTWAVLKFTKQFYRRNYHV